MTKQIPLAQCKGPNTGGWQDRHAAATRESNGLLTILMGWERYAHEYEKRFESKIGTDYVIGAAWIDIGTAIQNLLNGETGNLDCGTVDKWLHETALLHEAELS